MSIKLLGTAVLTVALLTGGILLNGSLTPSFALSPSERPAPLPPVHLNLPGKEHGSTGGAPAHGDAARLLELMSASDAILTGTVIAEAHALDGTMAVSTLEVRDWLKGGTAHYIRIAQPAVGGGSLLQSGESYLLMLRGDGQASDLYRVAGEAGEGKFKQRDGAWANDDPLLTIALQSWSKKQPAALAKKLAS